MPVARSGWVDAVGFKRWRDVHDDAGLDPTDSVPGGVLSVVAKSEVIVCSDLRRSVESAHRIAPSRIIVQTALLRESNLPIPSWLPIRLPVAAWDALIHIQWGVQILQRADTSIDDLRRAEQVLTWLGNQEQFNGAVAVVTHGVFRRILANRAVKLGWTELTRRRSYKYWSVWSFLKPFQPLPIPSKRH